MPSITRQVSFTSMAMAQGTFPPKAGCPDCIVNAAAYFVGTPPTTEALASSVVTPLLDHERFSKVLDVKRKQFRESISAYTALDLIREVTVQGDTDTTHQEIHAHLQDDLQTNRNDMPWWELLVIKNTGDGLSAVVIRLHHSIGDGLGLVKAFGNIWTAEDGSPIETLTDRLSAMARPKMNIFAKIWSVIVATIYVVTLGLSKFDDDTVFSKCNHGKMVRTGSSKVVMLPSVPLEFIKRLKVAAGVTVNDVLLAAISHSVRVYCESKNDTTLESRGERTQCRALLPVGFPRSKTEIENGGVMNNKWCLVSCDMALGEADVKERVFKIRANMMERKSKPYAMVQLWFQNNVMRFFPSSLAQKFALDAFSRHSLVVTNVPGPSQACMIAGKRVDSVQIFVSNLLTQVDLVSYNGTVSGNIVYDPNSLEDMEIFPENYVKALIEMAEQMKVDVPDELFGRLA